MQLSPSVYLVGSGGLGFNLTSKFDCHVYLIDGGNELALIDTGSGMDSELILMNIEKHGFSIQDIKHILITHAHGDHCGGATFFEERSGAKVYASEFAGELIKKADQAGMAVTLAKAAGIYPPEYEVTPCQVDQYLEEGDTVKIGNLNLKVYETPGHSDGHLSFYGKINGKDCLFAGDLIFHGGKIALQNIPDCSIQKYAQSMNKFRSHMIDALLPGHLTISLSEGQHPINQANEWFDKLLVPPSI